MGWLADISTIKNGPYRIHDYVQNESIRLLKTKTACCDVKKLLRGVACSIRLFFYL